MALATLTPQFPGTAYNILHYNCVTFCRALSFKLGVAPKDFPTWVDRTAGFGRAMESLSSIFDFDIARPEEDVDEKDGWMDIPETEEISYPSTEDSLPSTSTESPSSAEKRKSSSIVSMRGCVDKVSSCCYASPMSPCQPASGSTIGSMIWAEEGSGGR